MLSSDDYRVERRAKRRHFIRYGSMFAALALTVPLVFTSTPLPRTRGGQPHQYRYQVAKLAACHDDGATSMRDRGWWQARKDCARGGGRCASISPGARTPWRRTTPPPASWRPTTSRAGACSATVSCCSTTAGSRCRRPGHRPTPTRIDGRQESCLSSGRIRRYGHRPDPGQRRADGRRGPGQRPAGCRCHLLTLTAGPDADEPFDAEDLARRTAARARVDPGRGREYATAVLATLCEDVAGVQGSATGCRPTTGRCSVRWRRPRSAPWWRVSRDRRGRDTTTLGSPVNSGEPG